MTVKCMIARIQNTYPGHEFDTELLAVKDFHCFFRLFPTEIFKEEMSLMFRRIRKIVVHRVTILRHDIIGVNLSTFLSFVQTR